MTLFDLLVIGVLLLSALVSAMRGVISEVTSLVTWVVAFFVAKWFAEPFADFALSTIEPKSLAVVVAFVLLFAAAWMVQHFARSLLTSAVQAVGLGGLNRLFGAVFGLAKGLVLLTLVVLVCAFTDLPAKPDWQQAQTAPYLEQLALLAVPYLPPMLADDVHYPPRHPAALP